MRLAICGLILVALIGCQAKQSSNVTSATGKESAQKTYPRDEFRKLLAGKTEKEVLELIGKPDRTSEPLYVKHYWKYDENTTDPITGKTDRMVLIYFEDGRVIDFNF